MIELLVVVAIIAILLSILLPALGRAREQSKSLKCLANLKTLGQGVMLYAAEERSYLPGGLHPSIYRNQGLRALTEGAAGIPGVSLEQAQFQQKRFLTYKLRRVFSDSSQFEDSVSDQVATCPVAAGVNPEQNFAAFYERTNRRAYPSDYVINNLGAHGPQGGIMGNVRITDPTFYFGYSHHTPGQASGMDLERKNPPKRLEKIKQQSREWMIADAWYRPRNNTGFPALQQEGPYQFGWTGDALPYFPPHFSGRTYSYTNEDDRNSQAAQIRQGKKDGRTNTVYFDGHAVPVKSKTATANGFELLYGFEGTVNPNLENASDLEKDIVTKVYWE